jgi:hypothetical protein
MSIRPSLRAQLRRELLGLFYPVLQDHEGPGYDAKLKAHTMAEKAIEDLEHWISKQQPAVDYYTEKEYFNRYGHPEENE